MNLLITGAWRDAAEHIPDLEKMGHSVVFLQQEKDALPCDPAWVEGIIGNALFLYHPIEQFSHLRYIQLTSAGYDRVPMEYIWEHGIMVHNARGVYSIPMAEFAITGVLSLYKNMRFFQVNQRSHVWAKQREIRELHGKIVLIVGCGNVGTECAKRFGAFGCRMIGIDLIPRNDEHFDAMHGLDALDDVLVKADIVVLTVPLTEETRGLIDSRRLSLIHGILVNIARGAVVDQKALEQWTGEAVLDVFEEEPLPADIALWDKKGFIITPHNSFVGESNGDRLNAVILENMEEYDGLRTEKHA